MLVVFIDKNMSVYVFLYRYFHVLIFITVILSKYVSHFMSFVVTSKIVDIPMKTLLKAKNKKKRLPSLSREKFKNLGLAAPAKKSDRILFLLCVRLRKMIQRASSYACDCKETPGANVFANDLLFIKLFFIELSSFFFCDSVPED